MGHLSSHHIQNFVAGQTITELRSDPSAPDCFRLHFEDGDSLRLYAHKRGCECCKVEIIATPYRADGEIKQSTMITTQEVGDGK